jgi:hypothetical protein
MSDYDEHNLYFQYRKQRAIEVANFESESAPCAPALTCCQVR